MRERASPGELSLVAVATLVVSGYALARAGQTGIHTATAVGMFALAIFVLGVAWPFVTLRRVEVDVRSARDAVVGDEVELLVRLSGRARRLEIRALDPPGPWHGTSAPGAGTLLHRATRRGVFRFLRIELRSRGPLGVMSRRRVLVTNLHEPVLVGPRPTPMRWTPVSTPALASTDAAAQSRTLADAVRGVRDYMPGDPARLVHWPTSARTATIVVREHETPPTTGLALVVALSGNEPADERAASAAAGLGRAVLAAGGRLLLVTTERDGAVMREVDGALDLQRRLARCIPGPAADPPPEWPMQVVGR